MVRRLYHAKKTEFRRPIVMKIMILTAIASIIAAVVAVFVWKMLGIDGAAVVGGGVGGAVGAVVATSLANKAKKKEEEQG